MSADDCANDFHACVLWISFKILDENGILMVRKPQNQHEGPVKVFHDPQDAHGFYRAMAAHREQGAAMAAHAVVNAFNPHHMGGGVPEHKKKK